MVGHSTTITLDPNRAPGAPSATLARYATENARLRTEAQRLREECDGWRGEALRATAQTARLRRSAARLRAALARALGLASDLSDEAEALAVLLDQHELGEDRGVPRSTLPPVPPAREVPIPPPPPEILPDAPNPTGPNTAGRGAVPRSGNPWGAIHEVPTVRGGSATLECTCYVPPLGPEIEEVPLG